MDFVTTHVVSAVGITLVHFLWQGAAIGLVTAAVLATCPRAMARTRYGIAGAGLAAMTMAPLVTLGLVWQTAPAMTAGLPAFATDVQVQAGDGRFAGVPAALSPWLPVAVAVWALGVAALTTRLLVAWFRTERVRRRDVHPVSDGLTAAVRRLARDIGIHRPIAIFESRWVDVPTVIGWIRPTILLPIGALMGLSVQQVEAVLSHELAHVKRHDYLVNVLQNFAETVFFYHPAVWWLSTQIRIEREHCCDDVAVEACGNPLLYARALAALEESRQRSATFALAATDGSLIERVRRLVGPVHDDRREPSLPIAACVAVILAVLAFGAAQAQGSSASIADEAQTPQARVTLFAGGAAMPTAPERAASEVSQEVTPESTVPFARIDDETIQVNGETYRRGTAEDLQRVLRSARNAQQRATVTTATQEEPARVLRVGGDIREPRKIRNVNPIYPQAARAAGISGVVILETTIDTEGLPVGIKILRSIPDLDQAAINAVRQWRYEPTLLNGEPVSVVMTVTVNFTLQTPAQQQQQLQEALERRYAELLRLREEDALNGTVEQSDAAARALEFERLRRQLQQLEAARAARQTREAAERERQHAVETMSSTLATLQQQTAQNAPLRVGGPIQEPRRIRNVNPAYPKIAQATNVSGVVILDIIVSATGDVTDVSIVRSIPMLDDAAIEAVRQWRYLPTLLNGVPTPVQMTVTVNFTLN